MFDNDLNTTLICSSATESCLSNLLSETEDSEDSKLVIPRTAKAVLSTYYSIRRKCSIKNMFYKIAPNLQQNSLQLYLKKRLLHRCFLVNIAKSTSLLNI